MKSLLLKPKFKPFKKSTFLASLNQNSWPVYDAKEIKIQEQKEAIEKLFAISKYKMPSTEGVSPPYTTDKPPSFKDAPEIETKEKPAVIDSEAGTPESPEEKGASTPTSVETIVNKTEREEQRTSSIDSQMMQKFVKKYINDLQEKDLIDLDKFLNIDDTNLYNFYNGFETDFEIEKNNISLLFKSFKY